MRCIVPYCLTSQKEKKKSQNSKNLNVRAVSTFPGASKFDNFILLSQLYFERFEHPIGILVFLLENPYNETDCPKNLQKDCFMSTQQSSKFQVFTFNRFKVKQFRPMVTE